MWKFDALAMPSLREMAANDAAMADVIVIATRGEEDLPADVKAWSELWLGRQSSAFALVALFTEPDQHAERVKTTQSYLGWIAARGGMEFFAQPDVWPEDLASRRFTQKRGGDDSRSTIFSVAAVPTRNTNVGHWGLNE
jgi:hypothetical protein